MFPSLAVDKLTDNAQRVGFLAAALQHQLLSDPSSHTSSTASRTAAVVVTEASRETAEKQKSPFTLAIAAAAAESVAAARRAEADADQTGSYDRHRKRSSFSVTEAGAMDEEEEEREAAAARQISILQKSLVDLDAVVAGLKSKENRDCKREMRKLMRRRERESLQEGEGTAAHRKASSAADPKNGFGTTATPQLPSSDFFLRSTSTQKKDQALSGDPSAGFPLTGTSGANLMREAAASTAMLPPFYSKDPLSRDAKEAFQSFMKSNEIQLRFNSISTWDETHAKVLDLLTDEGHRDAVSLSEYKEAMVEFEEWCTERGFSHILPRNQSIRNSRCFTQSALSVAKQPGLTLALFYSCPAIPKEEGGEGSDRSGSKRPLGEEDDDDDNDESSGDDTDKEKKDSQQQQGASSFVGMEDPSTDDDTLARTIRSSAPHKVDARALFARYVKSISIVKTEAELIMCDEDYDGRVTLAELEGYMAEIIPTVASLQQLLPEDMVPYYTCSSARRLFWLLDPSNRGTIKISSLITNPVIDDWLEVQMTAEEQPRNWFGATIALQLREKFELLDILCTSALTLDCMKRYKKGIPMVVDDGLPKDESPLSTLFLQRVFETTNPPHGAMDYAAFVDFVVAIEFLPNSCPRPLFFWRILDIFGEGRVTPLVVHAFFKETYAKLKSAEVEVAPIEVIIQELFDLIPTREPLIITKEEFVGSNQCGLFSALVVDCLAFYTYENREHK